MTVPISLSSATLVAHDQTSARTFAAQNSRYINVKGFGATGNGTTDDWQAIQNAVNWTTGLNRGTLYFPPGTYSISQPITMSLNNIVMHMRWSPGVTITGNFADFLIKYVYSTTANSGSQVGIIEKLTLVNTHANGGGIRYGTCDGGTMKDLRITANQGINTTIDDVTWTAFETSIFNCVLDPGSATTGSNGMMLGADGPVSNCVFVGYDCGVRSIGGQGAQFFNGCYFKNCVVGMAPGTLTSGANSVGGTYFAGGSRFKDCGTGVWFKGSNSLARWEGIHIGATEGTISGNPQYGLRWESIGVTSGYIAGINVSGQFQQFGIYVAGAEANVRRNFMAGAGAVNTSTLGGIAWRTSTSLTTGRFVACNTAFVYNFSSTVARHISSASWSSGTTSIVTSPAHNMGTGNIVVVSGISVGGTTANNFNGVFSITQANATTLMYPLPSNPGTADTTNAGVVTAVAASFIENISTVSWTGGIVTIATPDAHHAQIGSQVVVSLIQVGGTTNNGYNGTFSAWSGGLTIVNATTLQYNVASDPGAATVSTGRINVSPTDQSNPNLLVATQLNIRDCNTASWGASCAGGGSNHVSMRWNGYDWRVIGK